MNNLIYQGEYDSRQMAILDNEFCLFLSASVQEIVLNGTGSGTITVIAPDSDRFTGDMENGECRILIDKNVDAFAAFRFEIDESIILTQVEFLFI